MCYVTEAVGESIVEAHREQRTLPFVFYEAQIIVSERIPVQTQIALQRISIQRSFLLASV